MSDPAMLYLLDRFLDFQMVPFTGEYSDHRRPDIVLGRYGDTTRDRKLVAHNVGSCLILGSGYSPSNGAGFFADKWNRKITLVDHTSYSNHMLMVNFNALMAFAESLQGRCVICWSLNDIVIYLPPDDKAFSQTIFKMQGIAENYKGWDARKFMDVWGGVRPETTV